MLMESISKMKGEKLKRIVRCSVIDAAGEALVDMITDRVNQIIVEEVFSAEWELSTIVNCYKG